MRRPGLLLLAAAVMGCSSLADDFILGRQGQIDHELSWHQDPQSEIVNCHTFKTDNEQLVEVDRIRVDFPVGSHHVHVYRSSQPEPDGVTDCSAGIDWTRWSLVVGVQTQPMDWQLPDGVTVPLAPHQQFLVQVHWLNATDHPIDRSIRIRLHTTTESRDHLGVAFGVSKDVRLGPGEQKRTSAWCPLPVGAKLAAVMGHFHARGRHYAADLRPSGTAEPRQPVYEAADEQTFEFRRYSPEPVVLPGDGIAYACDFFNDLAETLTWGPDTKRQEHCNLAAYYYPAGNDLSHLYLAGEVLELEGAAMAGEAATLAVTLGSPAGPDGVDVALESGDPGALSVPSQVHVPAWAQRASFAVMAAQPARAVAVRATTGAGWTEATVPVWGLELSELYYNPDQAGPGLQWIEIENVSHQPIDLGRYSLGAGGSGYSTTRVGLGSRLLPPGGCLVVGGAHSAVLPPDDPAAGVLVERSELVPALGYGEGAADGVALFDVSADAPIDGRVPLDALVYGAKNSRGLLGRDGAPAVPVAGTPPGWSLERASGVDFGPQLVPSPGICRVTHAP
jgi:hypothetical protein